MTYGNKALSEEQEENEYILYINNYRSLRTGNEDEYIQIKLGKITVLMGQRGSGKSSIIEAIHLLNTAYIYTRNNKSTRAMFVEAGDPMNPKMVDETEPISLQLNNYTVNTSKKLNLLYPKKTTLYDLINRMGNESKLLLRRGDEFFGLILSIDMEKMMADIKEMPHLHLINDDSYALMDIVIKMASLDPSTISIKRLSRNFVTYISTVNRLIPSRESMELKEVKKEALDRIIIEGIGPHGHKLEWALKIIDGRYGTPYEKLLSEIHDEFIKIYNRILEKEGAPYNLEDITFNSIEDEIMVHYSNEYGEFSLPLSQLSKGTLNLISVTLQIVLADIFSKKFNTDYIIMIEEPEATLHSSALQALVDYIISNNNPRLRFLLTSHSFRLLAAIHASLLANNIEGINGPYIVYVLSKERDLTTKVNEYNLLDTGELIAASMEPLSIEELKTIHRILTLGGPIEP